MDTIKGMSKKEYYSQYYKNKRGSEAPLLKCEHCGTEHTKSNYSKHLKTNKHFRNTHAKDDEEKNNINAKLDRLEKMLAGLISSDSESASE